MCGVCKCHGICGGSRARAYALTGDYLESDAWCVFKPGAVKGVPAGGGGSGR